MKRRELVLLLTGAMISARTLRAQQKAMPVIGYLSGSSADKSARISPLSARGSRELGYVEGQNVAIEYHKAEGHYDRLPALAADLIDRNVSAIAAWAFDCWRRKRPPQQFRLYSSRVPIRSTGLVSNFNRPDGNLTGIHMSQRRLATKQIEMLPEMVPKAKAMGVIVNPTQPLLCKRIGRSAGSCPRPEDSSSLSCRYAEEIDQAFASVAQQGAGAVFILTDRLIPGSAGPTRRIAESLYAAQQCMRGVNSLDWEG